MHQCVDDARVKEDFLHL